MRRFDLKGALGLMCATMVTSMIAGCAMPNDKPPSLLETQLVERVEKAVSVDEIAPGFAIAVIGPTAEKSYAAAAGVADPDGRAFTPETPLRIASNTKTFTAATIMRLWEKDLVDLDASISGLIDPAFDTLLKDDGYDTDAITVRHLLMHTAGLPDHADAGYVGIVTADPSRQWTRLEQMELAVSAHDPLGPPDGQFSYSDTGYILLGDMIERLTGDHLATAVRRELKFSEIGLSATWWEQVENPPAQAAKRASQYVSGVDATSWNGSMDLYGGGGLVMSASDMATFMVALFRGQVFDDPKTLEEMTTAPGNPFPDNYRIGLFPRTIEGYEGFFHSGFWGTFVIYFPELDSAISFAVLEQSGYGSSFGPVIETLKDIIADRSGE